MVNAVVCEFNPIHNGHKYLLDKIKCDSDDICVLIMSGNFVQRGEAAVFDKYTRAGWALKCGADIVLELPFPWSVSGAEFFAGAGVNIAEKCYCDKLVFGSGCGDTKLLKSAAFSIQSDEYIKYITSRIAEGAAGLKFRYLKDKLGDDCNRLNNANDILGIEYLKAIWKNDILGYSVIKRTEGESVVSASNIRNLIYNGNISECEKYVPANIFGEMKKVFNAGDVVLCQDKLFDIIFYYLRLACIDSPADFAECGGGLGERILSASRSSISGEEMLKVACTKKYTNSRIRRAALYLAMRIRKEILFEKCPYSVLLASNEKGRVHLKKIKEKKEFYIITKPSDYVKYPSEIRHFYNYLKRVDDLYALIKRNPAAAGEYLKKKPVIL